jgi:hypothetical protein
MRAKKKGRITGPSHLLLTANLLGLGGRYLLSLQTFRPTVDDERHLAAFFQRAIPARFDGRKVNEYIFAIFARDEPVSFTGIKPLHCTCLFHLLYLSRTTWRSYCALPFEQSKSNEFPEID